MSHRDDRPLWWDEGNIPWDEFQLACAMAVECGIEQRVAARMTRRWPGLEQKWVAEAEDYSVEDFMPYARVAQKGLRR